MPLNREFKIKNDLNVLGRILSGGQDLSLLFTTNWVLSTYNSTFRVSGDDALKVEGINGIDVRSNPDTETLTISGINASTTERGVASFNSTYFNVADGAVTPKDATTTDKGVASFNSTYFDVVNGAVTPKIATNTQIGVASFNSNSLDVTNGSVSAKTATTTQPGIASFSSTNFDVVNGLVTVKPGGISNNNLAGNITNDKLANSTITFAADNSSTAIALGSTVTIQGTVNQIASTNSGGTITLSIPNTFVVPGTLQVTGQSNVANLNVNGNLFVSGSATFANTTVTSTSALSVINTGPSVALYVKNLNKAYDVASFVDGDGVEVMHIGNSQADGRGRVGINVSEPAIDGLSVHGAISASDVLLVPRIVTELHGSSNQWFSNYTSTRLNSALWDSAYVTVSALSAYWEEFTHGNLTDIVTNSGRWDIAYTGITSNSGRYESAYTSTQTNSALWSSVYSTLSGLSGRFVIDGGNSLGGPLTIGTNDNQNLVLETNNTTRVTITNAGAIVGQASQDIFNTTTTTANILGAATNIILGATTGTLQLRNATLTIANATNATIGGGTGVTNYSIGAQATATGNTKTINIGTNGAAGSITNINLGSGLGTSTVNVSGTIVTNNHGSSLLWGSAYTSLSALSGRFVIDGGNSLGGPLTIGTNDNQNLVLETNGIVRATILNTGNIGIGVTNPSTALDVNGTINTNAHGSSINWWSTYNSLNANSGRYESVYAVVSALSASWEEFTNDSLTDITSNSGRWDSNYTTTRLNSALWSSVYVTVSALSAFWEEFTHDSLTDITSNSGRWDSNYTTTRLNSALWSSVYATVSALSASWEEFTSESLTEITTTSGRWNSVYSSVNANSSRYESVYATVSALSAYWEEFTHDSLTNIVSNSARWESNYTSTSLNSARWDSAYTSVSSFSGRDFVYTNTYARVSALEVNGTTSKSVVRGVHSITSTGDFVELDTFDKNRFNSIKYLVQVRNLTTNERVALEVLTTKNVSTWEGTVYAIVDQANLLRNVEVDSSGPAVQLEFTLNGNDTYTIVSVGDALTD